MFWWGFDISQCGPPLLWYSQVSTEVYHREAWLFWIPRPSLCIHQWAAGDAIQTNLHLSHGWVPWPSPESPSSFSCLNHFILSYLAHLWVGGPVHESPKGHSSPVKHSLRCSHSNMSPDTFPGAIYSTLGIWVACLCPGHLTSLYIFTKVNTEYNGSSSGILYG